MEEYSSFEQIREAARNWLTFTKYLEKISGVKVNSCEQLIEIFGAISYMAKKNGSLDELKAELNCQTDKRLS